MEIKKNFDVTYHSFILSEQEILDLKLLVSEKMINLFVGERNGYIPSNMVEDQIHRLNNILDDINYNKR